MTGTARPTPTGRPNAMASTRRLSATAWTPGAGGAASIIHGSGAAAKLTSKKENVLTSRIDLLRMLHCVPRSEQCGKKIGLINDPDCVPAEKPDQYGLRIDRMKDGTLAWDPDVFGFSSGVVGLQLFKNENFDAKKWSIDKYLDDASNVEPPYLVGMACTFCHTAFNPNRPPKNPAEPKWENLDSHIGSQYFREGMLFGTACRRTPSPGEYLYNQSPGTSRNHPFPGRLRQQPGPDQLDLPPERSTQSGSYRPNLARAEGRVCDRSISTSACPKTTGSAETDSGRRATVPRGSQPPESTR